MNEVDNPWSALPESPPYVLDVDRDAVYQHNAHAAAQHRLQLELMPEPFLGRRDAPVVVLLGNPGYSVHDHMWHEQAQFRDAIRANLWHERTTYAHPLLDPAFSQASGSRWWTARLRRLIEATDLRTVADNLLVLEALPYHSKEYRGHGIPSQLYTRHLLAQAQARQALVVHVRGPWCRWDPALEFYPGLLRTSSPQVAHLSPRNLGEAGFQRVVEALADRTA